jgi:hypothetical protein
MPAPATPNVVYSSGDYTEATPISLPVFDAPFRADGININYVLTQEFMQNLADFERLALDTAHHDYADFILVEESELRDASGGRVRWTRTYAKVPTNYSVEDDTFAFEFPGFSGLVTGGIVGYGGSDDGRLPLQKTVTTTKSRAFFLNPTAIDIPVLEQFQATYGTAEVPTRYVNDNASNPLYDDTDPSRTEYDALVTAGTLLVVQDSTRRIWMGNIYMRETFSTPAQ